MGTEPRRASRRAAAIAAVFCAMAWSWAGGAAVGAQADKGGGTGAERGAAREGKGKKNEDGKKGAPPEATAAPAQSATPGGWSVALASYSGEGHAERAAGALQRVHALGLPDARIEARGSGSVVTLGSFADPGSAEAKAALARARGIVVDGEPVFAGAFLAPPSQGGAAGKNDLRGARDEFGRSVRYSLQIGVYESKERREAERAAEEAAASLRRAGEPAYYFHGPTRSMVTVGAFTEKEARAFMDRAGGQTTGEGSAELWELFRRHPQNLLNGNLSLVEKPLGTAGESAKGKKGEGSKAKAQSSFLVEIP